MLTSTALVAPSTSPVPCPAWCVADHGDDPPADIFHRSERIALAPASRTLRGGEGDGMQMIAHLVQPAVVLDEHDAPVISVDLDGRFSLYAELDVAAADDMLARLRNYTDRLQALRDTLARIAR